jgi:hypothetical protein
MPGLCSRWEAPSLYEFDFTAWRASPAARAQLKSYFNSREFLQILVFVGGGMSTASAWQGDQLINLKITNSSNRNLLLAHGHGVFCENTCKTMTCCCGTLLD